MSVHAYRARRVEFAWQFSAGGAACSWLDGKRTRTTSTKSAGTRSTRAISAAHSRASSNSAGASAPATAVVCARYACGCNTGNTIARRFAAAAPCCRKSPCGRRHQATCSPRSSAHRRRFADGAAGYARRTAHGKAKRASMRRAAISIRRSAPRPTRSAATPSRRCRKAATRRSRALCLQAPGVSQDSAASGLVPCPQRPRQCAIPHQRRDAARRRHRLRQRS